MSAVLLVEDTQGDTIAVGPFPTIGAAREWEDEHPDLSVVGCVRLLGRRAGLAAATT